VNQSPSIPELNERAREVFRQIVDSYLASGAPVGSRTLSKLGALGLSPASIRNVMQDLEELGLLAAPHVSAGRKPTELGLRLFVDGMMQAAAPSEAERAAIEQPIQAGSPMTELLTRTTAVLSGLSACAGLVLVPKAEPVLRQINFVALAPRKALAILVGADGSVENRVLDLPADLPATVLIEAANYINARLSGLTLSAAAAQLAREIADDRAAIDALTATLVDAGLASWSADGAARPVLIVRGQAHLLDDGATDLERVRLLLDDIEGKQDLVQVLELAQNAAAMKIFIGAENKLFALSGSSVIAAPYRVGGSDSAVVGVIGVIGPTRLNYARIVPMVDYTAKTLSRLIA
jgi:heat-inducible transcriptional repressor